MKKFGKLFLLGLVVGFILVLSIYFIPSNKTHEIYYISYNCDGGQMSMEDNPTSYSVSTLPISLKQPIKKGYEFLGWYDNNGNRVDNINSLNGNINLTAKWTPLYSIDYVLNGGVNSSNNPTSYSILSDTIILENPHKENMVFDGWYLDGEMVTEISQYSSGNITLVAEWYSFGLIVENNTIVDASNCVDEVVILPKNTTTICSYAFSNNELKEIVFPEKLTEIGEYAFSNCYNLQSVEFGANLTSIKEHSFYNCKSLESVLFDKNCFVTVLPRSVFEGCEKIKKVVLPDALNSIKDDAFKNCYKLTRITLPSSLTFLSGFYGSGIEEIIIPSSVKMISSYSFSNTHLKRIVIPIGVEVMGYYVFDGCDIDLKIYCENSVISNEWDSAWNKTQSGKEYSYILNF